MEQLIYAPVASIIFVITLAVSIWAFYRPELLGKLMLHPYSVARNEKTYTVITSGFVHRDWMHLLFNMFSFFFFAFNLERMIGHWQFAVLYMVSLVLSDIPSVIKHKDHYGYFSLGASGAISAVVFAFIMHEPTATLQLFPIPIDIWAFVYGVIYLLYCTYASKHSNDAINHDAHLFGGLAGVIMAVLFGHNVLPDFVSQVTEALRGLGHH